MVEIGMEPVQIRSGRLKRFTEVKFLPMLLLVAMVASWKFLGTRSVVTQLMMVGIITLSYVRGAVKRGETPRQMGFDTSQLASGLGWGFLLGAVLMVGTVGALVTFGWYTISWKPDASVLNMISITVFFALVAVVEEVLFRGMLMRWLERKRGTVFALTVSSVIFGAVHLTNPNGNLAGAIGITVAAGLLLGGAYLFGRSLWLPIGIHWSWNLVQGPVLGARVSGLTFSSLFQSRPTGPEVWTGASFGPEAGMMSVVFGASAGIWLVWSAHKRGNFRRRPVDPALVGLSEAAGLGVAPSGNEPHEHLVGGEAPVTRHESGLTLIGGVGEPDRLPRGEDDVPDPPTDSR